MHNRRIQKSLLRAAALGLLLWGTGAFPENGWAVGRTVGSTANTAASSYKSVKSGAATYADKFKNSRVGQYAQKKAQQAKTKVENASRYVQKRRVDAYNKKIADIDKKLSDKTIPQDRFLKLNKEREALIVARDKMAGKIAAGRSPGKSSAPKSDAPPSYDQAVGKNPPPYTEKPGPGEITIDSNPTQNNKY